MAGEGKFQYRLESLLKTRRLEQETARVEEVAARKLVEARRQEVESVERMITTAEDELREQYSHGSELDTDKQRLLLTYLAHQRLELEKKQRDENDAVEAHEKLAGELEQALRGVKTLEKHKESRRLQFDAEGRRTEQQMVDELWLIREGDGKSVFSSAEDHGRKTK